MIGWYMFMNEMSNRENTFKQSAYFIVVIAFFASLPYFGENTLGFSMVEKVVGIVLNAITAVVAYICFEEIYADTRISLVCDALYTLSIYRLYELIQLKSLAVGWAFACIPLVICGIFCLITKEKQMKSKWKGWLYLGVGILGVLLPMVSEASRARFSSGRLIQWEGLYLPQLMFHFWTKGEYTPSPEVGMKFSQPIGVGMVLFVGYVVFMIMWFSGVFRKEKGREVMFVKLCGGFAGILMLMSMVFFPWDRIQGLHPILASVVSFIDSPDHFLIAAIVFMVVVYGFLLKCAGKQSKVLFFVGVASAFMGVMTSGLYLLDYMRC